jgi:hypothetical protein
LANPLVVPQSVCPLGSKADIGACPRHWDYSAEDARRLDRHQKCSSKCGAPQDRADLNCRPDATASRRNATRHRLLTAAPFVESSLRTVLLAESLPTVKFYFYPARATVKFIFWRKSDANVYQLGANSRQ